MASTRVFQGTKIPFCHAKNRQQIVTMSQETPRSPSDALSSLRIDRSLKTRKAARSGGWLRWLAIGLVLSLIAVGGTAWAMRTGWFEAGAWQDSLSLPDAIRSRPDLQIIRPSIQKGRSADATVVATGYLESRRQAKIGARAVGRVEELHVEEGSQVRKDEVLAVLEHADLDASLAATRASVSRAEAATEEQRVVIEQSRRDFQRADRLLASRSISQDEYDQAKFTLDSSLARLKSLQAEVELAKARLREAEQLKENMFIRAPFDGTVISKDAEVGESIMPGGMGEASGRGSAVTIADLANLEVDCDVKEDFIARVSEGQATEVAVDAVPNKRYRGRVRKIIPMGDRARATIKVKVAITDNDGRLFPEMSSTVYFLPDANESASQDDQRSRMFCPEDCLVRDEQSSFVWIVDDENHVQRAAVTLGDIKDGRAEVLSGLEGNERIVLKPPELRQNQAVKVSQ